MGNSCSSIDFCNKADDEGGLVDIKEIEKIKISDKRRTAAN